MQSFSRPIDTSAFHDLPGRGVNGSATAGNSLIRDGSRWIKRNVRKWQEVSGE
jgi:hypothetical protein